MSAVSLQDQFPVIHKALNAPYAKDIKLNLSSLLEGNEPVNFSKLQIASLALAAAYATRQPVVVLQYFTEYAKQCGIQNDALHAIKAAVSIMAMNNVYYRSVHIIKNEMYQHLPSRLRMNILQTHGINQQEFELYCVVVSAINGCGRCLDSHVSVLEKSGVGTSEIQYSLRIASVVQAVAQVCLLETSEA